MITNYKRPIITAGNDFYINITMTEIQGEDILNFDLTKCKSVEVYLICATHNTKIDLDFEILDTPEHNVIKAFVDHRMLHNTSYGVCVEGDYEDDLHWRWYMLPKEGFLIIPNTSGQNIPTEVEYVDLAGRVGFGVDLSNYYNKTETDILLEGKVDVTYLTENYYDKTETDTLLEAKADTTDLGDYYTKTETDTLLSSKADSSDLANKQDVLISGDNIKTINNESLLGSGNITIETGGNYTAGDNIDITNNTISLEDDITVSSVTINKHIDYVLWWDGENRYLAEEAWLGNQFQVGQNWYDIGNEYKLYIKTGQADYTINGSEWTKAEQPYPSYLPIYDDIYKSITQVNGQYVYGRYNPDSGNPDFYIYDDNITINDVYVEYEFLEQSDWNETNPNDPGYIHNKPDLSIYAQSSSLATVATSGNYNDLSNTPTIPAAPVQSDWNESDNTTLSYILNKPDLSNYATQSDLANKQDVLVSGTNIKTINNTSLLGSGDITISGGGVQSNWNESDSSSLAYIQNKPTIPAAQVQSNWNESDNTSLSYIQNKPDLSNYVQSSSLATVATSGDYNDLSNKPTINTPGFNQLINGNNTGLVSSLSTVYNTNIGKGAVIEGEGYRSVKIEASGELSHAEGFCTFAKGHYSHTEGSGTTAQGQFSHAEGYNTKTNNVAEHASGRYNISVNNSGTWGNSGNTLFSIGNGNGLLAQHNAIEIKQNGDIYIPDTNNTTYSNFYEKPMLKLQDVIANKQDVLVSGTNIKTINNQSILGSGDITISGGGVQSNWNETDSSSLAYILNKPTIPAAPVQSNWNETDTSSLAYIQNKPTIPSQYYDMDIIYYFELPSSSNSYAFRLWIYNVVVYSNGQVVWGSYDEGYTTQNTISDIFNYIKNTYGINYEILLNSTQLINNWPSFVKSGREYYLNIPATVGGNTLKPGDTFVIRHRYNTWYNYKQTTIQIPYVNAVTSSVNGMKIEVVNSWPQASPSNDTIYVVV